MISLSESAVLQASKGLKTYVKFLSANDTGLTGGHQAGIYIAKPAVPIIFDKPCERGSNMERPIRIQWQNDFFTTSCAKYYGQKTRNEYRITQFGRGFELLNPQYTGGLFVLTQLSADDYAAFVLNTEDEINYFLDSFGISAVETGALINTHNLQATLEERELAAMTEFVNHLQTDFPSSEDMSAEARKIENALHNHAEWIVSNPDSKLLNWTDTEYRLFRHIENIRFNGVIQNGFESIEEFLALAGQIMNRRKSRAGKSLEHHLAALFDGNRIEYQPQAITEGKKKPDFLFPSSAAYHDRNFPDDKLVSLAAKTTCKDRWRQILNEADRLRGKHKYLCTLQQGISAAQMDEMQSEKVILVVPQPYIHTYPKDRQDRIWTISKFIQYLKSIQN